MASTEILPCLESNLRHTAKDLSEPKTAERVNLAAILAGKFRNPLPRLQGLPRAVLSINGTLNYSI